MPEENNTEKPDLGVTDGHGNRTRKYIKEVILDNQRLAPRNRLTPKQLAEKIGCKVATIYQTRERMRTKGLLGPRVNNETGSLPTAPLPDDVVRLFERAGKGEVLTKDERKAIGSALLATVSDAYKGGILSILNRMDEEQQQRIGPVPPQTEAEALTRLKRVLHSAPPSLAERAWREYGEERAASESAETQQSQSVTAS